MSGDVDPQLCLPLHGDSLQSSGCLFAEPFAQNTQGPVPAQMFPVEPMCFWVCDTNGGVPPTFRCSPVSSTEPASQDQDILGAKSCVRPAVLEESGDD